MFWNERRKNIITVYCILGGVGLVYLLVMAITGHGFPCFYQYFAGKPCPFCGFSRMAFAMMQGHFSQAFGYHPVGAVLTPFWLGISALLFWGKPKFLLKPAVLYTLLGLSLAAIVIFGYIRNGTL